jgi:O-antigen/teichoic acid export membrane protein
MLTVIRSKLETLKGHQGFQRYAANTSWMMAEQMLRMIAGLLVGFWVARYLGPKQFGLFSYVLAFTSIFGGIAKLGLDGILVRDLVNQPKLRDTYLGTAFWLRVIGALLVMALMAMIMPFTSNDATTNLFIFIIATGLVFQSFEVVEYYFQSQVLAKVVSICKVSQLVLSSAIKIYLVLSESDLIWFVLVTAIDAFSLALSYLIAYSQRKNNSFFKYFNYETAKKMLHESLPLMLASLGFVLFSNIDTIMIKELIDEDAVGIYSAAYKLAVMWYFFPGLILNSLMPAIVNSKNYPDEYKRRKQKITAFLVWFAIALALISTLLSDSIIKYTFGSDYKESSELLSLLMWINVIIFFNSCWNKFQIIDGNSKFVFYFHFLTVILNVFFNFLLIPALGLIGAALAILISLTSSLLLFTFIDKNTLPLILGSLSFGRIK